jgi:two-component system OmpR family sensor kinase
MKIARAPLVIALLGLLGSLGATLYLYRAAAGALDRGQHQRLNDAGLTASVLLSERPTLETLRLVRDANALDAAYVVTPDLRIVADTAGGTGKADLLRTNPRAVLEALARRPSVGHGYSLGELEVLTGYFPVVAPAGGAPRSVLVLEAGRIFEEERHQLRHALWFGLALSVVGAIALAIVALLWSRAEAERREAGEKAARGEALTRIAAAAAHEIRNPLSVIKGSVELLQLRGEALDESTRESLQDVLGEVERLRRLTDDLLDLSADRALASERVDVRLLLQDVARSAARGHTGAKIVAQSDELFVRGDAGRLRQVLLNLAQNAAQSGAGQVTLRARRNEARATLTVEDDGPGIAPSVRSRLFEPFVTGKANGTGIGLAVSKRLVERHGGTLKLLDTEKGTTFEVVLQAEA